MEVIINYLNEYLTLSTLKGEITAKIKISYEESDEKEPLVELKLYYDGKVYHSSNYDYFWIRTFANLQNQLPKDINIKCCLTCKHGNLCPVGNCHNELFCTKDVVINEKSDLFFYTEEDNERDTRSRKYTFVCNDYKPQNNDYFTYNDYLYYLVK